MIRLAHYYNDEGEGLGTKENIEYIKQELSNEEKFLESVIKLEKFYKKYKKALLSALIACALFVVGYMGYEWKKDRDLRVSNQLFQKLLVNPNDKEALENLRSLNPKLYDLYLYQKAMRTKDARLFEKLASAQDPILSDLAKYHLAVLQQDTKALERYGMQEGALLREMALLDDGYLWMKGKKITRAKEELSGVPKESSAYPYSLLLKHFGTKVSR